MSKNISSNSLFHFTPKIEYLKDILENGFWPRYCREYGWSNQYIDFALPMVCFCDIPLSQISEHVGFYGKFGIGVSAEWIRKQKTITPVQYIASNTYEYDHIGRLLTKLKNGQLSNDESRKLTLAKKVSGEARLRDGSTKSKKFYDEREWRHVPEGLSLDDLLIKVEKKAGFYPDNFSSKTNNRRLRIDIDSIKYLVIPSDREREKMIDVIRTIFSKEPEQKVNILVSKILSIYQIENDF